MEEFITVSQPKLIKNQSSVNKSVDSEAASIYGKNFKESKTNFGIFEHRLQKLPSNKENFNQRNKVSYYRRPSNVSNSSGIIPLTRRRSSIANHLDIRSSLNRNYK